MCGIVGVLNLHDSEPPDEQQIRSMLLMIQHRGPDQYGIYLAPRIALGSARLSILDLEGGQQPICNEDKSLWIVFNGEIFNHVELRTELEARGHIFSNRCDTEVVLHLYEDEGPECLKRLNGQFAIAIWDERNSSMFLARDRLGIRPLFYTNLKGRMLFGSEIKAIASHPLVKLAIDPVALHQAFTFWSVLPPRSAFVGIMEIPPGCYLLAANGHYVITKYWQMDFPNSAQDGSDNNIEIPESELLEQFRGLLIDAVKIRLRADVPVGAYLSGGLDSSILSFIVQQFGSSRLDTFSISFNDSAFDESSYQEQMAGYLGTDHHAIHAAYEDIGRVFPDVIWHTETPLLRTSPAPMFLLSQMVQKNGYKVVLTGEGADEFLAGYDIFKEAKIRRFWARYPKSEFRPLLLRRLYKEIPRLSQAGSRFVSAFFKEGLTDVESPCYSHSIRWRNTQRIKRFFSDELTQSDPEAPYAATDAIDYPSSFDRWGPLEKGEYLEVATFLSPYLLSSQGDRVAMAHSIEGRYPFLDYRVVAFCSRLPANFKLRALKDKYLLRKLAKTWLPPEICQRSKQAYRAPIHQSFLGKCIPAYVSDLLSCTALSDSGFFKPEAVAGLLKKLGAGTVVSEIDEMALTGIISCQLLHHLFIKDFRKPQLSANKADMKICRAAIPKAS